MLRLSPPAVAVSAAALFLALAAAPTPRAAAQCGGRWIYGPEQTAPASWGLGYYQSSFESYRPVLATVVWDPDGPGPQPYQMIIGGSFTETQDQTPLKRIARWDGVQWQMLGTGIPSGTVNALTVWDPDGPGPMASRVVAGGNFATAGGVAVGNIGMWDGSQWSALPGAGTVGQVRALTTWDPDGPGPMAPRLVVAGSLTTAGGTPVNRIAIHDGTQWSALGAGLDGDVYALTSWDPDGDGPATPVLVAGGVFINAGGQSANRVAIWDGSQWSALGTGLNSDVRSLVSWDADGSGPGAPKLVAGGKFVATGGRAIASWDGTQWIGVGGGLTTSPGSAAPFPIGYALTTWDADGQNGPIPPELVVAGAFDNPGGQSGLNVAAWNGSQWRPVDFGLWGQSSPSRATYPYAITSWDPDGPGPSGDKLLAGGDFFLASYVFGSAHVAVGDGQKWEPLGIGMDGEVYSAFNWEGDGSSSPVLAMGGSFTYVDGLIANSVATWDGAHWSTLGSGITPDHGVYGLNQWDRDGAGPNPNELVAVGDFDKPIGKNTSHWDGTQWSAFGGQSWSSTVTCITSWDPDDAGPEQPRPVAGANGIVRQMIAGAWVNLGSSQGAQVRSVLAFDPDGPGPAPSKLYAAGDFPGGIKVYNGSTWDPVSGGTNAPVYSLARWDPDGDGPAPAQLVVGGVFSLAGGIMCNSVAAWDGDAWHPFGTGPGGNGVSCVGVWDPDGPGPRHPEVIASGTFSGLGNLARWDGSQWVSFGGGIGSPASAIVPFYRHGSDAAPVELIIAGILTAGGQPSRGWARWSDTSVPWVAREPQPQTVAAGTTASITVTPASGYDYAGPLLFQWYRNGTAVSDGAGGASPGGGIVSGTHTATLVIDGVAASDAGDYSCFVANTCGGAPSGSAALTVTAGACPADLTHDGLVDFSDYLQFLNFYDAGDLAVDFNGDGQVDFGDYLEFLNHYDAGC